MDLLFVYGTLRKGFPHPMADLLASKAEYKGQGMTEGQLFDLGPYPAAIFSENSQNVVVGDVFRMNDPISLLPLVDEYEDYRANDVENCLYKRILIRVVCEGQKMDTWAYSFRSLPPKEGLIPHGDYLTYLQETNAQ